MRLIYDNNGWGAYIDNPSLAKVVEIFKGINKSENDRNRFGITLQNNLGILVIASAIGYPERVQVIFTGIIPHLISEIWSFKLLDTSLERIEDDEHYVEIMMHDRNTADAYLYQTVTKEYALVVLKSFYNNKLSEDLPWSRRG